MVEQTTLLGFSTPSGWGDLGTVIGGLASSIAAIVAVAAAFYAREQIGHGRRIQHEILAQQTYASYLLVAFQNPEISSGMTDRSIKRDLERYEWYISYMLNACEGILMHLPRDKYWEACIVSQLGYHKDYFSKDKFFKDTYQNHYSVNLVRLIDRVVRKST